MRLLKLRNVVIPGLLSPLILLLFSLSASGYAGFFYVKPTSVPLRECASPACDALLTVYQGDKVEILERTGAGWSRVRLVDRSGAGWIRSNLLSYSPDLQGKPVPPYHVNTSSLALRAHPNPHAGVLTYLHFNDRVEMLGVTSSGWAQVRDFKTSKVGYVPPRYLSSKPLGHRKSSRRHRSPAPKPAPKKEKAPSTPNVM